MSVITTADEKIREAKDRLGEAYKLLLSVLDENTWGHSDFNEEYLDRIQKVSLNILKSKGELK